MRRYADCERQSRVFCFRHGTLTSIPPAGSPAYDYAFASHAEAREFAVLTPGAANPLALVPQRVRRRTSTGASVHVRKRVTDWPKVVLRRPRRTDRTIRDFLAPDAPPNRLAILRGEA